eukprot:1984534-Pyramimonas_sp.AAC.1
MLSSAPWWPPSGDGAPLPLAPRSGGGGGPRVAAPEGAAGPASRAPWKVRSRCKCWLVMRPSAAVGGGAQSGW